MEVKKTKGATLENQKSVYMQIGMIMVLSAILIALEWTKTEVKISNNLVYTPIQFEDDIVPITRHLEQPSPPPPPQATEIEIVKDEIVTNVIPDFISELSDDTKIEYFVPIIPLVDEFREEPDFVYISEEMPEFPGGEAALQRYLSSSIKYPAIAIENGISGKVYVQFIIDKNGEVTNVTIARGADPSLNREAIRVVEAMPNWKPGKNGSRPVRVSYTVPILFVLKN